LVSSLVSIERPLAALERPSLGSSPISARDLRPDIPRTGADPVTACVATGTGESELVRCRQHTADFLDKSHEHGGLALSRPIASLVMAAVIVVLILVLPQRPGEHPAKA
jgi:hypothetical protein